MQTGLVTIAYDSTKIATIFLGRILICHMRKSILYFWLIMYARA